MSTTLTTIDEYIAEFPTEIQERLNILRATITELVPGVEEAITYNMPTFMLNGQKVIYFACWKQHVALYPITSEMEAELTDLAAYPTSGKGTVQLPHSKPLPLELVRKIVEMRLKDLA